MLVNYMIKPDLQKPDLQKPDLERPVIDWMNGELKSIRSDGS
jgi:hypothetical protein